MKTKIILAVLLLAALGARAQTSTITASKIGDVGGNLITGSWCVTPAQQFVRGGGGNVTTSTVCYPVTAGALPAGVVLADTSLTNPAHVCYRVAVESEYGVPVIQQACMQPSGSTFNYDNFVQAAPPNAALSYSSLQFGSTMVPLSPTAPSGSNNYLCSIGGQIAGCPGGGALSWQQGGWNSTVAYTVGQAVSYLGSSYLALVANTNVVPTSSTTDWALLAQAGATGAAGPNSVSSATISVLSGPLGADGSHIQVETSAQIAAALSATPSPLAASTVTSPLINNRVIACGFPGATADAQIAAAFASLPSSLGVVDATCYGSGTEVLAGTIVVAQGQTILFSPATQIVPASASSNVIELHGGTASAMATGGYVDGLTVNLSAYSSSYSGAIINRDASTTTYGAKALNIAVVGAVAAPGSIVSISIGAANVGVAFDTYQNIVATNMLSPIVLRTSASGSWINSNRFINLTLDGENMDAITLSNAGLEIRGNLFTYSIEGVNYTGLGIGGTSTGTNPVQANRFEGDIWDEVTSIALGSGFVNNTFTGNVDGTISLLPSNDWFRVVQVLNVATSSANSNGNPWYFSGRYFNGTGSAVDTWECFDDLSHWSGVPTSPLSELHCTHSGSTGGGRLVVPSLAADSFGGTGTPTAVAGISAGSTSGATITPISGYAQDSTEGMYQLHTGTTTVAGSALVTITFPEPRKLAPVCMVQIGSLTGAGLQSTYLQTATTTALTITSSPTALLASSDYGVLYLCGGN